MKTQIYEIQHFGFSGEQITLERQYVLKTIINVLLDPVLEKLTKSADTSALLLKQKTKVVEKILDSFQDKLQELEAEDIKNFSIPGHVLLSEDFEHLKNYTEDDEKHLDDEISDLKQVFLENSIMIAALEMENSQYESIDTLLQEELQVHSHIEESLNEVDVVKATELVSNLLSLNR